MVHVLRCISRFNLSGTTLRQECLTDAFLIINRMMELNDDVLEYWATFGEWWYWYHTQIHTYEYRPTALSHGSDKNFPLGSDNFTQSQPSNQVDVTSDFNSLPLRSSCCPHDPNYKLLHCICNYSENFLANDGRRK